MGYGTYFIEDNTVQYSTVQYSTVRYSTVQYSTVQKMQYYTIKYLTSNGTIICSHLTLTYSTSQEVLAVF